MAGSSSKKKGHGRHHDLALTVTAVLVISGVLVLQVLARRLKRWSERQKHANDILEASERELSVLGLIAFGLFVLEQTAAVSHGDWVAVFHEVHFALFTVALFYVVANVALYALSRYFGRLWRRFEEAEMADHWTITAQMHRLRAQLRIPPLEHHLFFGSYWIKGLARHPVAWLAYQKCLEHMTFHEVRRDFLRVHHLPHSFSFAAYLESCMQHVCLEFSEIRDTVWSLGILGLVVHLFFSTLLSAPSVETTLTWLGSAVAGLCVIVFFKVKWIYWFLLHSEILYRDESPPPPPTSPRHRDDDHDAKRDDLEDPRHHDGDDDRQVSAASTAAGDNTFFKTEQQSLSSSLSGLHRSLFWFGNPGLVVTLLETCLFVLSGSIALFFYKLDKLQGDHKLAAPVTALGIALCLLFVLVPRIVPRFTLITHVGEMSDPRRIADVVRKQQERGDFADATGGNFTRKRRRDLDYHNAGSRRTVADWVRATLRGMIDEPGISAASAVASLAFAFSVAVTLNERGARSVLNGHAVLVLRDIELILGTVFVMESTARLWAAPSEVARRLDFVLVVPTVAANVASFVLRPAGPGARSLHAFSAFLVVRVVTTMWHQELRALRFEHIRLSPDDLLKAKTGLSRSNLVADPDDAVFSSLPPSDSDGSKNGNKIAAAAAAAAATNSAALQSLPAWVGFYRPPPRTSPQERQPNLLDTIDEHAVADNPALEDTPLVKRAAAKQHALELFEAALVSVETTPDLHSDPARLVKGTLERALAQLEETHASPGLDRRPLLAERRPSPILEPPQLRAVMSTQDEELEDSLYFNTVLKYGVCTKSKEKRRSASFSSSLLGGVDGLFCVTAAASASFRNRATTVDRHDDAENKRVWHKVKLILTRDQLLWYAADALLSEHLPDSGLVRDVLAETAEPVAIALNAPNAHDPMGKVHLHTVLKLDAKNDHELTCVTTAFVIVFSFENVGDPVDWKGAILDAIDREDDDDPVHPLIAARQRNVSDPSMAFATDSMRSITCDALDDKKNHHVVGDICLLKPQQPQCPNDFVLHGDTLLEEVKQIARTQAAEEDAKTSF
ncbi:hypothetical protein CTAYLR_007082 [Chrysophaeum taylorii]|uniref:Uncharacterized protein n=1 Tax=Chrysophaeum taylorii TaxID=2483200 RepID=A0AAD7ULJ4_9STRA|nr:hypothetical protein CTAYLR_007082 [Chrysophaeum taylorii]